MIHVGSRRLPQPSAMSSRPSPSRHRPLPPTAINNVQCCLLTPPPAIAPSREGACRSREKTAASLGTPQVGPNIVICPTGFCRISHTSFFPPLYYPPALAAAAAAASDGGSSSCCSFLPIYLVSSLLILHASPRSAYYWHRAFGSTLVPSTITRTKSRRTA
jgi:hypothetical protein